LFGKKVKSLFGHLDCTQESYNLHYWDILWAVVLRRNTEKLGSKLNIPQGNGIFTAPPDIERSSCCLSTKPGDPELWCILHLETLAQLQKRLMHLHSLPCFYLKMLVL
jgi:hypothetical protein